MRLNRVTLLDSLDRIYSIERKFRLEGPRTTTTTAARADTTTDLSLRQTQPVKYAFKVLNAEDYKTL
jgi:hypothetical protein